MQEVMDTMDTKENKDNTMVISMDLARVVVPHFEVAAIIVGSSAIVPRNALTAGAARERARSRRANVREHVGPAATPGIVLGTARRGRVPARKAKEPTTPHPTSITPFSGG